jgi:hypothetical protein
MDRTYYHIGNLKVFRLSKDRCQRLLYAILACQGQIHDCMTFSLDCKTGKLLDGIPVGKADAVFSISIKKGTEDLFRGIMGEALLEVPPTIHVN